MKHIIKQGAIFNHYDHDIESYSRTFDSPIKARRSRGQLKRYGWIVDAPESQLLTQTVTAIRRTK